MSKGRERKKDMFKKDAINICQNADLKKKRTENNPIGWPDSKLAAKTGEMIAC